MKDAVALITGSGRGIGAASARLFAEKGYRVVLTSRTHDELRQVAATIPEGRSLTVAGDIADEVFVKKLFAQTLKAFGRLDVLVNNAGKAHVGPLIDLDTRTWDEIMAVNLRAVFLCSREALRAFRAQGRGGSIVNISSLGGIAGTEKFAGFAAYSASKFAVTGLTECLAVEGKPLGVRVNCVAPGAVDTRMLRDNLPHLKTETGPEVIAKIVVDLSDPAKSADVTGTVLPVYSNL